MQHFAAMIYRIALVLMVFAIAAIVSAHVGKADTFKVSFCILATVAVVSAIAEEVWRKP